MNNNGLPSPGPSAFLLDLHAHLVRRYSAPGVQLDGFESRWMAFRRRELQQGVECAVLDVVVEDEAFGVEERLLEEARRLAGEQEVLVTVELALTEWEQRHRRQTDSASLPRTVLSLVLHETDQSAGVWGTIELDEQGCATGRASRPLPLLSLC